MLGRSYHVVGQLEVFLAFLQQPGRILALLVFRNGGLYLTVPVFFHLIPPVLEAAQAHFSLQAFQDALILLYELGGIGAGQHLLDDALAAAAHDASIIDHCCVICEKIQADHDDEGYSAYNDENLVQQLLDQIGYGFVTHGHTS